MSVAHMWHLNELLLWLPQLLVSGGAAFAWLVTAVYVSRNRLNPLQVGAVVLACAHAAGAGRAILTGLGQLPTDPFTSAVHFGTAGACLSVALSILYSRLAEPYRSPDEPCSARVTSPVPVETKGTSHEPHRYRSEAAR